MNLHSKIVDGKRVPLHTIHEHGCEICNIYWNHKLRVEQSTAWLEQYEREDAHGKQIREST